MDSKSAMIAIATISSMSGPIAEAPGESWNAVEAALRGGKRGLPGGSSLAQVLETARGKRNLANLPPITEEMILEWADAYRERTGKWPSYVSGPVAAGRTERWNTVIDPLPGKLPKDNFRPLKIDARHDGATMLEFLNGVLGHVSPGHWLSRIEAGDLVNADHQPVAASHRVHPGERYFTRERLQSEPDVNAAIEILHEDEALIVVNKPAPLPMHPSGRFHRNTLSAILAQVYAPQKPRPAHRLDANTSGIAVVTRTAAFAKMLQPQFERGEVKKRYLARVLGHPHEDVFDCDAPIATLPGHRGSRVVDEAAGASARTEFEVLKRFPDGTALLSVVPRTGRTNQIRVHLWHLGWPIQGDPMYLPGGRLGEVQTLAVLDSPLRLFASRLAFAHPQQGKPVAFEAPPPSWANG